MRVLKSIMRVAAVTTACIQGWAEYILDGAGRGRPFSYTAGCSVCLYPAVANALSLTRMARIVHPSMGPSEALLVSLVVASDLWLDLGELTCPIGNTPRSNKRARHLRAIGG